MKNKTIGAIILTLVVGVSAICGMKSAHKIKPGYVGIIYSLNGGIKDEVLTQGLRFVLPWEKVKQYSVSTEQGYLSKDQKEGSEGDDSFNVPTSDGKTVNVDLEYSYHFDSEKLPETYVRFKGQDGKTIEETFIRGKLKTWASEVSSTFSVMDIYGEKRTELNKALSDHINPLFEEYGIVIDAVNFSRIDLDSQTAEAIQTRINKQQEVETAKLEAEKATIDAQTKITQAEAEAKANEIKTQAIDNKILQQQFIEKWNGSLPTVVGSEGNIMDISSLIK